MSYPVVLYIVLMHVSSAYEIRKYHIRMAINDVYIEQSSMKKTHFFSFSDIIFAIVQANKEIFRKCFLRRTYIGEFYNIAA